MCVYPLPTVLEKLRIKFPNSLTRSTRISIIGALGVDGILTSLSYEGTLNANLFEYFVEHFLVPVLTPNQIVILDNASSHQSEKAIAMIETIRAGVVFLPPYSPFAAKVFFQKKL